LSGLTKPSLWKIRAALSAKPSSAGSTTSTPCAHGDASLLYEEWVGGGWGAGGKVRDTRARARAHTHTLCHTPRSPPSVRARHAALPPPVSRACTCPAIRARRRRSYRNGRRVESREVSLPGDAPSRCCLARAAAKLACSCVLAVLALTSRRRPAAPAPSSRAARRWHQPKLVSSH
jgi:hypothetical protein